VISTWLAAFTRNSRKKLGLIVRDLYRRLAGETRDTIRTSIDFSRRKLDAGNHSGLGSGFNVPGTESPDHVRKNGLITIDER